jgi:phage-related protein
LIWLGNVIRSPPFSTKARIEAGKWLRLLQLGEYLEMPHSRPMPAIGKSVHELRIKDKDHNWRLFYRIDSDAIILIHWLHKKTQQTSKQDIQLC